MQILLIGDVHGKIGRYKQLLHKHDPAYSIQLGDFGFKKEHDWHCKYINDPRHKILFGNHDYAPYVNKPHSLGDFGSIFSGHIFTIRGADSIDRARRIEGRDWWPEEEIGFAEWDRVIEEYAKIKPRIVLSHDCPQLIREQFFGIHDASRTSQGLQACFDIHRPDLWVFGHHHRSVSDDVFGTTFRCLAELEIMEIDV